MTAHVHMLAMYSELARCGRHHWQDSEHLELVEVPGHSGGESAYCCEACWGVTLRFPFSIWVVC